MPSTPRSTSGAGVVKRCFNRLKQWRGIATRYDKTARNYRGGVLLASLVLWSRT
jgi:transposase